VSAVLEGRALHTGQAVRVELARVDGPVVLRRGEHEARIDELRAVATARATTVARADGLVRLRTVEHLFAALGGLGVRAGVRVDVDGDELPLLDGAALAWARAIAALDPPRAPPPLVVARDAMIVVGASRYEFERADRSATPGARVSVTIDFDDARLEPHASWTSSADDFIGRIAPARTFAFARELDEMAARGLASYVSPDAVVILAPGAIHAGGAPFCPDEPARHKLLDLIGDLYMYGGPPRGGVRAFRPGHAATHAAVAEARARGVLTISP
jgi:UDP-3-O-[3-hydroxymyristoyl] N-acetylglucosamine deacetylase